MLIPQCFVQFNTPALPLGWYIFVIFGQWMVLNWILAFSLPSIYKTYKWPSKHHISRFDMSKWWNMIKAILPHQQSLRLPLGSWQYITKTDWLTSWDFFNTTDCLLLFRQVALGEWQRHLLKTDSRRSYHNAFLCMLKTPVSELLWVKVIISSTGIVVKSTSNFLSHVLRLDNDILWFGHI